jgi:hypothetical protein
MNISSDGEITKKVEESITPEMIEAGKSVLASSDSKSPGDSVEEIYVAMATKDRAVVKEQENKLQVKRSLRTDIILYFGAVVGLLIALTLIVRMIAA